ncbi:GntR family transcriptional regulator [Streptomyces tsukubensis]|uniref:GntR family transcriptional regulator n=1 Tax=Streptomyces tsukubensis TaxID=83656 RepID=A0A1V4A398_9ACTN|nr:GntR family transcriptional regulator [Streptomyces tsukubensis]OON74874.1 GntR family transcriptional regulator [Streptomyces tsukubensis]QFR94812.1 GntR family transcriptional regulator [Streptomyces tsukubensis]
MRGTDSSAVTRSTLRQQIADALRDEVLSGRLEPGQEFTVKEIAEQYGVSATPVREALVDLSAQGLLDSVQHRGFRVHEYSVGDFRSMIEARCLVTDALFRGCAAEVPYIGGGAHVGDNASTHAGTAATALLSVRRRGEEAQRAAAAGDLNILIGYDLRFWRELGALFENPYLSDFLHRLRVQSWVAAVPHLRRLGDLRGVLWTGHNELVSALGRRDRETAQAIIAGYNTASLALIERLAGE